MTKLFFGSAHCRIEGLIKRHIVVAMEKAGPFAVVFNSAVIQALAARRKASLEYNMRACR
jgi:hypothetical protein